MRERGEGSGEWRVRSNGNVPRPLIDSKVCALNNFSVAAPKTFADCLAPLPCLSLSLSPSHPLFKSLMSKLLDDILAKPLALELFNNYNAQSFKCATRSWRCSFACSEFFSVAYRRIQIGIEIKIKSQKQLHLVQPNMRLHCAQGVAKERGRGRRHW